MPGSNENYIKLLKNSPKQLIIILQPLIDSIIFKFIKSGKFLRNDHQEIKQQVNEALLKRIPKIQDQYHGKSHLFTYLTSVIRNICLDISKKKASLPVFLSFEEKIIIHENDKGFSSLVLEEEKKRLQKVLNLFYREENKLKLCLKIKYRMPFTFNDFKNVFCQINHADYEKFIEDIKPYISNTDILIFDALTILFNKYEIKNITPDALRKWYSKKIHEIIDILNVPSVSSKYTDETLQILFEMCYADEEYSTNIFK